MPTTEENQAQIDRLLAVARETIGSVRHCWVATHAEEGGAHARGVTAEPFGHGRTLIERAAGGWRFASD